MKARYLTLLFSLLMIQSQVKANNDPTRSGTLQGTVIEEATGKPLIGAIVMVLHTEFGAASDYAGNYTVNLHPGHYTVICQMATFKTDTLHRVHIQHNQITTLNFSMKEDKVMGEALVVKEKRITHTEGAVTQEIKEAKGVVSGVGAAQIAKSQDRDAGQVARRIPGVTIVDNRFVVIRGLSSRYNATLLNGVLTPSLESDSRAFSFDIIPSAAIDRFLIFKSPRADLPGEFAGGAVQVYTKNIPTHTTTLDVSMGTAFRKGTTFQPFFSNVNSGTEWLGIDHSRALPSDFSTNLALLSNDEDKAHAANELNNTWALEKGNAPLDQRLNVAIGKKFNIKKLQAGNYTAISYSHTYTKQLSERNDYNQYDATAGHSDTVFHYLDNIYQKTANVGFLNNWGLQWEKGSLEIKNFVNQNGQQSNTLRDGINIEEGNYRKEYSMRYTQRLLYSMQTNLNQNLFNNRGKFQAGFGFGTTIKNDPDWKRIRYTKPLDGSDPHFSAYVPFSAQPFYMGRLFMNLKESVRTYTASYEHKLYNTGTQEKENWVTVQTGVYVENKYRSFQSRNLGYAMANSLYFNDSLRYQPLDQILSSQNINSTTGFILDEDTRGADRYIAKNRLNAVYLMLTLPYQKWNVQGGVRCENNTQTLASSDITGNPISAKLDSTIWLPSLNVSYQITNKALIRTSYGKTVNRPEFRELAPFSFYDFENNFINSGNPNLTFAVVDNYDLRWEYYPKPAQTISAGVFYKHFAHPIEQYFVPGVGSGGTRSFIPGNALAANNYGAEVEIRKSLQGLFNKPSFLDYTVVVANASYIVSNIQLSASDANTGLNSERAMLGQSPYIINGGFYYDNDSTGWQMSALFNRIGPRIVIVGIPGVPEVYEMPRNVLDLSVGKNFNNGWGVKLGIQDALNASFVLLQDANNDQILDVDTDQVMQRFKRGPYFSAALTYTFKEK